jgi:hypothetical protein
MGLPIRSLSGSALRILIAWLIALQPMIGAYAASASAPLAMELCRGTVLDLAASDQGAPAGSDHSKECCLACAPAPAPPPDGSAELIAPSVFFGTAESRDESVFVAIAGLGPQAARDPPVSLSQQT